MVFTCENGFTNLILSSLHHREYTIGSTAPLGTPAFLRQTLSIAHQLTEKPLLVRMDSGNDAAENLGILIEDGSWFVIKRNLRKAEKKEEWLAKVQG